MGERVKFTIRMNSISLLVVLLTVAAGSAEEQVARKPKLFYVSTSATTSTIQALSVCFYTSTAVNACGGRKRRAIDIEGSRDGRFLLYWITTTSISTSTSFTVTYTVSS